MENIDTVSNVYNIFKNSVNILRRICTSNFKIDVYDISFNIKSGQ